jgi:hypothetical protein
MIYICLYMQAIWNNDLSPHANTNDKYKITTDLKVETDIITSIAANPFHH